MSDRERLDYLAEQSHSDWLLSKEMEKRESEVRKAKIRERQKVLKEVEAWLEEQIDVHIDFVVDSIIDDFRKHFLKEKASEGSKGNSESDAISSQVGVSPCVPRNKKEESLEEHDKKLEEKAGE